MDGRRRTLQSDPSHPNQLQSSIPIPSSAIKGKSALRTSSSQTNLRQSVAPGGGGGPQRMSMAPGAGSGGGGSGLSASQMSGSQSNQQGDGGFGGVPARRSTVMGGRQGGMDPALFLSGTKSNGGMYGKMSIGPATHTPGTGRRSSSYSSGMPRQSIAGGLNSSSALLPSSSMAGGSRAPDPRQVKSKPYIQHCKDNVASYLSNFNLQIGPKAWDSPTLKDFQQMFKTLVSVLDDGFQWGKSFEADCLMILKDMRYPYPEQVGKTALGAPGSPTTWPTILSMLNWMVELAKTLSAWRDPSLISDPFILRVDQIPMDHPNYPERVCVEFVEDAFKQWMEGAEQFPELLDEVDGRFEQLGAQVVKDKADREVVVRTLEARLNSLMTEEPPLRKLQTQQAQLEEDRTKFITYIHSAAAKQEKLDGVIVQLVEKLKDSKLELAKIQAKKESLESQVRQQNISPEEVTKMNNEQTNLKTSIAKHQHELADIKRKVGEEEMSIARKQDELEKLLEQYKTLGQNIHTIGSNRTLAPPHITSYLSDPSIREVNFDLDVQSDGMASAGSDLTSVGKETERMRHQIRPALQKYSELVNMDLQKRKTEEIQVKAEWDTLSAQVGMRNQQAKTLELKVDLKNREVEKVWAALQTEVEQSRKGVDDYEAQVNEIDMSGLVELRSTESEIDKIKLQRSELEHKIKHLREKLNGEIGGHMEMMMKTKEHASAKLIEVKNFAKSAK